MWPAFALVVGLLLVGVVAEADGLFAGAGAALARLPLGPRGLFLASLALVVAVTAVLNLDTSVFFLTPVLLRVARRRGIADAPFLYGAVFMSNAGSLFLPGSNLTNLIVLHGERVNGTVFFVRLLPGAAAAAIVTAAVLAVWFRRELRASTLADDEPVAVRLGVGAVAVALSTLLVLLLRNPALPVLAVGLVASAAARVGLARLRAAVDVRVLGLLLVLSLALGTLGRAWRGPENVFDTLDRGQTAVVGAFSSVVLNNLPAAVLFTPDPPRHARALLLGLNLGPNLAVTGSLSALLWLRVARSIGARPSVRVYSLLGLVVVPLSLGGALGALWLLAPGRL